MNCEHEPLELDLDMRPDFWPERGLITITEIGRASASIVIHICRKCLLLYATDLRPIPKIEDAT